MQGYRKCIAVLLAAVAVIGVLSANGFAQEEEREAKQLGVTVRAYGAGVGDAEFDDRDGGYSLASTGVSVSCPVATVSYALDAYDWSDKNALPFGNGSDDPWDALHMADVDLRHNAMIDEHWGWFVGGGVGSAWEEDMDDSFFATLRGGAIYAFTPDVNVSFGLAASINAIQLSVLPALSASYRKHSDEGFSATVGAPETWLRYRFNGQWLVRAGAFLNGNTYRLADDSTVEREGYLQTFEVVSALVADWSPISALRVSFGPDLHFARSMTIYNEDGERRNSYAADPAVGFSASVRYAF